VRDWRTDLSLNLLKRTSFAFYEVIFDEPFNARGEAAFKKSSVFLLSFHQGQ